VEAWAGRDAFRDVLARACDGDEQAFLVLWRWLHPALVRWLGVVAPGGGGDVESDVWFAVVRDLDSFDGDELAFRGWVFTIARRRAIDWGRRRRRLQTASLDGVELATRTDASERFWEQTELQAAVALLRTLKHEQAEVVALRIVVGLTVAETAAVVNKSAGAVRVLCHRGLRSLARQVTTEIREGA
jgi:RNA polymerase sigma-70 factor, ECF subfamily